MLDSGPAQKLVVSVCVGTSCFVRGGAVAAAGAGGLRGESRLEEQVEVQATFCFEQCDRGPTVQAAAQVENHCSLARACQLIEEQLAQATA